MSTPPPSFGLGEHFLSHPRPNPANENEHNLKSESDTKTFLKRFENSNSTASFNVDPKHSNPSTKEETCNENSFGDPYLVSSFPFSNDFTEKLGSTFFPNEKSGLSWNSPSFLSSPFLSVMNSNEKIYAEESTKCSISGSSSNMRVTSKSVKSDLLSDLENYSKPSSNSLSNSLHSGGNKPLNYSSLSSLIKGDTILPIQPKSPTQCSSPSNNPRQLTTYSTNSVSTSPSISSLLLSPSLPLNTVTSIQSPIGPIEVKIRGELASLVPMSSSNIKNVSNNSYS